MPQGDESFDKEGEPCKNIDHNAKDREDDIDFENGIHIQSQCHNHRHKSAWNNDND